MSHAFQGLPYSEVKEALQREIAKEVDRTLRDHSSAIARIIKGQVPVPGATTVSFGVTSHHLLTDLATFDDHPQYLYLAGRATQQIVTNVANGIMPLQVKAKSGTTVDILRAHTSSNIGFTVLSDGRAAIRSLGGDTGNSFDISIDATTATYPNLHIDSDRGVGSGKLDVYATVGWSGGSKAIEAGATTLENQSGFFYMVPLGGMAITPFSAFANGPSSSLFALRGKKADNTITRIQGASAQTANLTEWLNDGSTTLSKVDKDGKATFPAVSTSDGGLPSIFMVQPSIGSYITGGPEFDDASGFRMAVNGPSLGFTANRFLEMPDGSGILVLTIATQTLQNKSLNASCKLLCATAASGAAFVDNSNNSKALRMVLSGASANTHSFTFTPTAARDYKFEDVPGTAVIVGNGANPPAAGAVGKLNLITQGAAIAATKLTDTTPAGYYIVHYTLEDTTADVTAGTIQFQINYTDDIGATTQVGAALVMTATGRDRGTWEVYLASGNITYQTNVTGIFGTAKYALRVRCEFLG